MIVDLASSRGELVVNVDGLEGLRAGDELTAVQLAQDSLGGNTPGQVKGDPHEYHGNTIYCKYQEIHIC